MPCQSAVCVCVLVCGVCVRALHFHCESENFLDAVLCASLTGSKPILQWAKSQTSLRSRIVVYRCVILHACTIVSQLWLFFLYLSATLEQVPSTKSHKQRCNRVKQVSGANKPGFNE